MVRVYLASHSVWTQFAEAKRRRDFTQQSDNVEVLYTTPTHHIVYIYTTHAHHTVYTHQHMQIISCMRKEVEYLLCLGIIFRPKSHELVEMMRAKNGPITREVVKIVHDDSNKQVYDLQPIRIGVDSTC